LWQAAVVRMLAEAEAIRKKQALTGGPDERTPTASSSAGDRTGKAGFEPPSASPAAVQTGWRGVQVVRPGSRLGPGALGVVATLVDASHRDRLGRLKSPRVKSPPG
jgi:hypothetical protein